MSRLDPTRAVKAATEASIAHAAALRGAKSIGRSKKQEGEMLTLRYLLKEKIKAMKGRRVITFTELERRRARRDYMRRYRARGGKANGVRPYVTATIVPCAVEAEREAALAAARTPNQLLLGDPLPGRSALDKKNARANKRGIW